MTGNNHGKIYTAGIGVALVTAFLIVWTTIVRDDGHGMNYFLIVMAAGVGGFAARFQPAGLARALFGVATMQLLLGIATATAPIVARTPDGSFKALLSNGVFAALWLASAACFHLAARRQYRASATG